jgi:hypothetical protein
MPGSRGRRMFAASLAKSAQGQLQPIMTCPRPSAVLLNTRPEFARICTAHGDQVALHARVEHHLSGATRFVALNTVQGRVYRLGLPGHTLSWGARPRE